MSHSQQAINNFVLKFGGFDFCGSILIGENSQILTENY